MWVASTVKRDRTCFSPAPRKPRRRDLCATYGILLLLALGARGARDHLFGRERGLGGCVLHGTLRRDVHQHLARLLLGELERGTTGLVEVLEVALGVGHVALAEIGLTAQELRLVVVLLG